MKNSKLMFLIYDKNNKPIWLKEGHYTKLLTHLTNQKDNVKKTITK